MSFAAWKSCPSPGAKSNSMTVSVFSTPSVFRLILPSVVVIRFEGPRKEPGLLKLVVSGSVPVRSLYSSQRKSGIWVAIQRCREISWQHFQRASLQSGYIGCNTGNREKLSSRQAQLGQATCLAVAQFLSVSCVTSTLSALYIRALLEVDLQGLEKVMFLGCLF